MSWNQEPKFPPVAPFWRIEDEVPKAGKCWGRACDGWDKGWVVVPDSIGWPLSRYNANRAEACAGSTDCVGLQLTARMHDTTRLVEAGFGSYRALSCGPAFIGRRLNSESVQGDWSSARYDFPDHPVYADSVWVTITCAPQK